MSAILNNEAGPTADGTPGSPRFLRKAFGPLLTYHVLVLVGAFLLVSGIIGKSYGSVPAGWALIAGGIAVQAAVIGWAVWLIRSSPPGPSPATRPVPGGARKGSTWFCVGCGLRGVGTPTFCPRCGKIAVRRPPSATTSGSPDVTP